MTQREYNTIKVPIWLQLIDLLLLLNYLDTIFNQQQVKARSSKMYIELSVLIHNNKADWSLMRTENYITGRGNNLNSKKWVLG